MKAAVIDAFGSEKNLQIRDVPAPEPGAGQILVEVHATCVNPIDWKIPEEVDAVEARQEGASWIS